MQDDSKSFNLMNCTLQLLFKQDLLDDNFFYFMVSGLLSMFIVYHYEKIRKKHMINKKVGLKDTKVNSYKLGWI